MSTQTKSMPARRTNVRKLVILAVLSAIAYLTVFFFRIPMVEFLKYEPKDVIITIAAFLFGPLAAVPMSIVVSFIEMVTISSTGPIGMLMNIISTIGFASVAGIVYKKKRTLSGAVFGLLAGTAAMTVLMLLWNYFITPFYMGVPREVVANMLIPAFLPFNLVKAGLNSAIVLLLYKPVSNALHKTGLIEHSSADQGGRRISVTTLVVGALILATFILLGLLLAGKI